MALSISTCSPCANSSNLHSRSPPEVSPESTTTLFVPSLHDPLFLLKLDGHNQSGVAATRLYAVLLHPTHQSYCVVRPAKGGRARIEPPEALGASGETAEGCPVGARRAGASESLWKLKPSATSLEAETFPRLLNPKPNPPAAPGNTPPGQNPSTHQKTNNPTQFTQLPS
jgi:hypothetical protein